MIVSVDALDSPLEHIQSLYFYGAPILRTTCNQVDWSPEIKAIAQEMIKIMYSFGGVGLAAPQVGLPKRIIVIDKHEKAAEPMVLINPIITWKSDETRTMTEGCLSLPGLFKQVTRPQYIKVEYINENGHKQMVTLDRPEMEHIAQARVIQHEIDHLNGILIIDK